MGVLQLDEIICIKFISIFTENRKERLNGYLNAINA